MRNLLNLSGWLPMVMIAFIVISFVGALFGYPSLLVGWPLWLLIGAGALTMTLNVGGRFLTDYTRQDERAALTNTIMGFLAIYAPAMVLWAASLATLMVILMLAALALLAGWLMYISGRKRYEISKRQWYKRAIREQVQNIDCLHSYTAQVADWTDDCHETAVLVSRYWKLRELAEASQALLTARSKAEA